MGKPVTATKPFRLPETSAAPLANGKAGELLRQFAPAAERSKAAAPAAPQVTGSPVADSILSQVLAAKSPAGKAALIAASMARHYFGAPVPTGQALDHGAKPPPADKPEVQRAAPPNRTSGASRDVAMRQPGDQAVQIMPHPGDQASVGILPFPPQNGPQPHEPGTIGIPPFGAQPYAPPEPSIGITPFRAQPYAPSEPSIGITPFPPQNSQPGSIGIPPFPPQNSQPGSIGIPPFAHDVTAGPPAASMDHAIAPFARSLGGLAQSIERAQLPLSVKNGLLDQIARILPQLQQAARAGGDHRQTALLGVASLIQILDGSAPGSAVQKRGDLGKAEVMEQLRTMLFSAAVGRDVLHVRPHVA